jgi:hypothetical protein
MNRNIFFMCVACWLLLPTFCNAQDKIGLPKKYLFEGAGQLGWMMAGTNGAAKVRSVVNYTFSGAYIKNERTLYELNINTFGTKLYYPLYPDSTVRYNQTYVMFGIVRCFKIEIPSLIPYISSTIGFSNSSVKVAQSGSQLSLAAGLAGGLKIQLKDNWGLKMQARVQAPLSGLGLSVGVSTGGPSVGVGSYSSTMQFDFSAGVFVRL